MRETVVVSDLHGHADRFKSVVDYYGDNTHYVINGDSVDRGANTKELLDTIAYIDHSLLLGNHEWVLLGALENREPEERNAARIAYFLGQGRARYELNVLASYGITSYDAIDDTARALKERLLELGHWSLLRAAQVYYEDDQTFVVHAGLRTDKPMRINYHRLRNIQAQHESRRYADIPEELGSFALANCHERPIDLQKVLVTGHDHRTHFLENRSLSGMTPNPQRIFLASFLDMNYPLYAYESEAQNIREFH